ncbi:hypothetical protein [Pseudoduganella sp. HUAS MS19]
MRFRFGLPVAAAAAFLTGCATPLQAPVPMGYRPFAEPGLRIGVAMSKLPKADTSFPGAEWPLCHAAAALAHARLTAHTRTLPADDLAGLKDEIAQVLQRKGQIPVVIEEPLLVEQLPKTSSTVRNAAPRDYSALQARYRLDKLLVVELKELGITRAYSSYIPTGEPKGIVSGVSYMVDFKDHSYEWYLPLVQQKSALGNWDEAPAFPGLSNAYFQAIEAARQAVLQPLAN